MLKSSPNFDIFYKSVISKKNIFQQNNITISEVSDSQFNSNSDFIFEKKYLSLYTNKGNLLFEEPEKWDNKYKNIIQNIVKKINKNGSPQNRNGHVETGNLFINTIFIGDKDKLVFACIENINIISVGVFSVNTKTSIIKLYLLNFLIMFLNYLDNDINILHIIDNNNNNNIDDNIKLNIFKEILYPPFHQYFFLQTKQIFKRQKFNLKNLFYKKSYLIELNFNKIIFSFDSLYNNNDINIDKYQIKLHNKDQIWNEVLYHCHILKNTYINQFSLNFDELHYENYFAVFELKSTFPRRTFIIKFLPVLNGLAIIHEFVQAKLSSNEGNENNHYKEYESIYGYFNEVNTISQKTCNSSSSKLIFFRNEPIILKKINNFFIGSLSLNTSQKNLFSFKKHRNIYICDEIMKIINKYLKKENLCSNNNIMKDIIREIYEEYLKDNEKNDIDLNINNNNKILLYNNNEGFLLDDNNSQKLDFGISKNFIFTALFTNDKNLSKYINNQFSSRKNPGSRKDFTKFSEILNENISENIGSYCHSNNRILKDNNNSLKISNIFDSVNLINIDNSNNEANLFNINISIIGNIKNKNDEENKISDSNLKSLDSKEEFLDGETIHKVKYK